MKETTKENQQFMLSAQRMQVNRVEFSEHRDIAFSAAVLSPGGAAAADADGNEGENDGPTAGNGAGETLLVGRVLYSRSSGAH